MLEKCCLSKNMLSKIEKALQQEDIQKVNELIENNKDKRLFLSFWSGMTYDEFVKVKEYENQTGNLKNDKFLIPPIDFQPLLH